MPTFTLTDIAPGEVHATLARRILADGLFFGSSPLGYSQPKMKKSALRSKAHEAATRHGLLLLKCGVRSLRFRPPLDLTSAEADKGLGLLRESLKEL